MPYLLCTLELEFSSEMPSITEGAIQNGKYNGQSRETGNIEYTRKRKQYKNTMQYVLDTTIHKQTQMM